jgi:hypothetical protein
MNTTPDDDQPVAGLEWSLATRAQSMSLQEARIVSGRLSLGRRSARPVGEDPSPVAIAVVAVGAGVSAETPTYLVASTSSSASEISAGAKRSPSRRPRQRPDLAQLLDAGPDPPPVPA